MGAHREGEIPRDLARGGEIPRDLAPGGRYHGGAKSPGHRNGFKNTTLERGLI